jgi:hypothetical protein
MKTTLTTILIALTLCVSAAGQAPTLRETQEWISNSLKPSGPDGKLALSMSAPELASDSNGYNYYVSGYLDNGTTTPHYIELIASVEFQGCKTEVKKLTDTFLIGASSFRMEI